MTSLVNPAMKLEFDRLADLVSTAARGRPIAFLQNTGNWGDSLIREGAERFLETYGFHFRSFRHRDFYKGKRKWTEIHEALNHENPLYIYNGCGIYSGNYPGVRFIAELSHNVEDLLLFPSTFAIDLEAQGFSDRTKICVRDKFQSKARYPDALFCHDLAFFVSPGRWPAGRGSAIIMRRDPEAPKDLRLPRSNRDISSRGKTHTPIKNFLRIIASYETVHTNRLHVGVAATLLGRKTFIYSNNYFKIDAIFKSSIAPYFDNAELHAQFDPSYVKADPFWRHL